MWFVFGLEDEGGRRVADWDHYPGGMGAGLRFVWGLLDREPPRDLSCLPGASARCLNQDHCLLGDSASPLLSVSLSLLSSVWMLLRLQVSMDDRRRCCSGPAYVTTPSSTNTSLTIYIHSPATSLGKLVQSNVMGINGNKWRVFGFWTVGWTKEAIWRCHFGLWEIAMSIFPIFLD